MTKEELYIKACRHAVGEMIIKGDRSFVAYSYDGRQQIDWSDVLHYIDKQESKTGHWIEVIDDIDSLGNKTWHYKCSICANSGLGEYEYCPWCGAKMEEVKKC